MTSSLVGSEMCIRDSRQRLPLRGAYLHKRPSPGSQVLSHIRQTQRTYAVSYTHLTLPTICSV
eukprot:2951798-Prorocentrum_lima.AAC.1